MSKEAGAALALVRTCLFYFLIALLAPLSGRAAPAEVQRDELSALRSKIRSLQDEISRSEETHGEVADELAASDKIISQAQRKLRDIALERRRTEQEIERLANRRAELDAQLAEHRQRLGDTLFRLYVEGGQAGARRLLTGKDPNQLARDTYYLEQIAKERIAAINSARNVLAELNALSAEADARRTELLKLESDQRREQAVLLAERKTHQDVLNRIASQLRDQKREIVTLQRDETRLQKLIQGLERITRSPVRPSRPLQPKPSAPSKGQPNPSPSDSEPIVGRAEILPNATPSAGGFADQKGRLGWPVKGELVGRFGSHRPGGTTSWRGVFIKSQSGTDVKAVAGGTVAFADWLRGFGNLLIIDHGDGYMTVYGNNESVFKTAGETVKQGETIASVGASGGLDESGLYFEIRYRGQPQDPAKWVVGR